MTLTAVPIRFLDKFHKIKHAIGIMINDVAGEKFYDLNRWTNKRFVIQ